MPSLALYSRRTVCALMVMPRSRSISMESSTCSTISRSASPPVCWISRSASVDLPWSIWATMEKLRMLSIGWAVMGGGIAGRRRRRKPGSLAGQPAAAFNIHAMDFIAPAPAPARPRDFLYSPVLTRRPGLKRAPASKAFLSSRRKERNWPSEATEESGGAADRRRRRAATRRRGSTRSRSPLANPRRPAPRPRGGNPGSWPRRSAMAPSSR